MLDYTTVGLDPRCISWKSVGFSLCTITLEEVQFKFVILINPLKFIISVCAHARQREDTMYAVLVVLRIDPSHRCFLLHRNKQN